MTIPNSLTPGLLEVMNLAIDRFMCEIHTCMPAVIISYDPATQTATVQASLMRAYVGQAAQLLPQIFQVPVVFPATASAWLRLPLAAGDVVMLHFSERSLDAWSQNGGSVDPQVPHKFSLADAIAVPGLRPQSQAIQPVGAPTSAELVNAGGRVEVTNAGKFKVQSATGVELLAALKTLLTDIQTGVCVNGSPLTMPTFTADLAVFSSLMG